MSRIRVRSGDTGRDDDPLESQYAAVLHFLEGLCHNLDLAKDLAQQTYLRAYSHLARHARRIDNPRAWLLRIARRVFIDHVRARAVRPHAHPESFDAIADPRANRSADSVEVREEIVELGRAMEALDPLSRDLLVGHHLDGECLKKLAQRYGVSPAAARVRVWRARRKLPGYRG